MYASSLERTVRLRTSQSNLSTTTPNIADLLLRTSKARAILGDSTALRLVEIKQLDQSLVLQHCTRQLVKESCIQRCRVRPTEGVVCAPGVVLKFPYRSIPSQRLRDISEIGLHAHNIECLSVDLEKLVACIVARKRRD